MHTTTSKAVLTPLADAVSQLIVIVSDSETEGTAMPDLSALATAVDAQIANLVGVGRKIQAQPSADETLKKEMPVACDSVTKSSQLLVSSTSDLVKDPFSSSGRQRLLEAVKGILSGTTDVLNVFDDAEVRKILSACNTLRTHLASISKGIAAAPSQQAYVTSIAQASQTIVTLAQLTNKRVTELLYAILQTRLKAAVAVLTKESPLLITACKITLVTPGPDAENLRSTSCQRLEETCREIEIVVQFRSEDEAMAVQGVGEIGRIRKALAEDYNPQILAAALSGSPQQLKAALEEHGKALDSVVSHGKVALKIISDPAQRAQIQTLLSEIVQARDVVEKAAADAQADPRNPEKQQRLRDALDALTDRTNALDTALNRAIIGDLSTVLGSLADHTNAGSVLGALHAAAKAGDTAALPTATKDFKEEAGKLHQLATMAIDTVGASNPALAQEVRIVRDRVAGLAPAVGVAAEMVVQDPKNAAAQEYLGGVTAAWEDGIKEMQKTVVGQEGVFKAHELIAGTRNAFDQHAKALAAATASGDIRATHKEAANLASAATQFVAIAKKEAENTEDAVYRRELEVKIQEVEIVLPKLLSAAEIVLQKHDPSAINAASDLFAAINGITASLTGLGGVIKTYKGAPPDVLTLPPKPVLPPVPTEKAPILPPQPKKDEVLALAEKLGDVVIVEAEAPVMLSEQEAKENPIKAAGQELKVEASNWTAEQNPVVAAATTISQQLLDLSTFHNQLKNSPTPAAKKAFIAAAQAITQESTTIATSARILVDACTDRRLKAQLQTTLERITSLGQQLKIVAAVKASAPMDRDRDAQLVSCATNLMMAVKACLRDCESASLRVRTGFVSEIRFRKQVFRRRQFGEQ
ncbi:hypothetical protein HK104_009373 [Borealophlyctis nickersoniae]|nr:hypothetical protein HK104_009373 [Borealophlyctis nickersoniae]